MFFFLLFVISLEYIQTVKDIVKPSHCSFRGVNVNENGRVVATGILENGNLHHDD